jgi:hypothetical protein
MEKFRKTFLLTSILSSFAQLASRGNLRELIEPRMLFRALKVVIIVYLVVRCETKFSTLLSPHLESLRIPPSSDESLLVSRPRRVGIAKS